MNKELEKCGWYAFLSGILSVFVFVAYDMIIFREVYKLLLFLAACFFAKSKGRSAWWGVLSLIVVACLRDRNIIYAKGKGYHLAAYIAIICVSSALSIIGFLCVVTFWDLLNFNGVSAFICVVVLLVLIIYFLRSLNRYLVDVFKV